MMVFKYVINVEIWRFYLAGSEAMLLDSVKGL
jgi:hypothetical protein